MQTLERGREPPAPTTAERRAANSRIRARVDHAGHHVLPIGNWKQVTSWPMIRLDNQLNWPDKIRKKPGEIAFCALLLPPPVPARNP